MPDKPKLPGGLVVWVRKWRQEHHLAFAIGLAAVAVVFAVLLVLLQGVVLRVILGAAFFVASVAFLWILWDVPGSRRWAPWGLLGVITAAAVIVVLLRTQVAENSDHNAKVSQLVIDPEAISNVDPKAMLWAYNTGLSAVHHFCGWLFIRLVGDKPGLTPSNIIKSLMPLEQDDEIAPGDKRGASISGWLESQRRVEKTTPIDRLYVYYLYENSLGQIVEDERAFVYTNDKVRYAGVRLEMIPGFEKLKPLGRRACQHESRP